MNKLLVILLFTPLFSYAGTLNTFTLPSKNTCEGSYYADIQSSFPQVDFNTLDRLYIPAGHYSFYQIGNLPQRNSSNPLVISNQGGQVRVGGCGHHYNFNISGGSNWKLTGEFSQQNQTGDVQFKQVNPTGHSTLNSGTGDVKFIVTGKIAGDLELNSGTGDAVLDFDGQKIEGDFEMKCGIRSGRIVAPFEFDSERQVGQRGNGHIEKAAKIGGADFDVEISTGTGKAEVRS